MNKMKRERKKKKKNWEKLLVSLHLCATRETHRNKYRTLGNDWLCVMAAQATYINRNYFTQYTADL